VVATAGGRGGGRPFSSSFSVFFFALLFFLFLLSSSFSLLGATGGCGEEEQRWRCRAEDGRWWFFFFPLSTPLVFFLSVLFCFSSPSLVLLALATLLVAEWRCWMVVAEGHGGERGAAAGNPKWMIFFLTLDLLRSLSFSSFLSGLCFLFLSPFSRLASLSVTLFYCHVGRVWLCGYVFWQGFRQVEGRESEQEKHFQKSSSSLPLHAQGRRRTVPFKTALFRLFFLYKKRKM